jgi:hypothetical protein
MTGPVLVGQFWGLDSDRILKLVLRENHTLPRDSDAPGQPPTRPSLISPMLFGRVWARKVGLPMAWMPTSPTAVDEGGCVPALQLPNPFDSDLQPWSSKSCREEKWQTSFPKTGKSCSNAKR